MKAKVITLDSKDAGEIELNDAVFGLEMRKDILQRVVEWQRARARAGTHKTKQRNEVSRTTKKAYRQKGTGNARMGAAKTAPHHVGGGRAHGPVVRSHEYKLPKKVRQLGLKIALSTKQASGQLVIIDDAKVKDAKTKKISESFAKLGWKKPLIVTGSEMDESFALAARNVKGVDILPSEGANVYDIIKHKELVLTKVAVEQLEARLAS